jgi:hypothetical protein
MLLRALKAGGGKVGFWPRCCPADTPNPCAISICVSLVALLPIGARLCCHWHAAAARCGCIPWCAQRSLPKRVSGPPHFCHCFLACVLLRACTACSPRARNATWGPFLERNACSSAAAARVFMLCEASQLYCQQRGSNGVAAGPECCCLPAERPMPVCFRAHSAVSRVYYWAKNQGL